MADWNRKPKAVHGLLHHVRRSLRRPYDYADLAPNEFSFHPDESPMVYLVGHCEARFSKKTVARMRDYVLGGGFMLCECCCGDPNRMEWYRKLLSHMFPDRELHRLALDHPLFRSATPISRVSFLNSGKETTGPPVLWGIDVGCRTPVIVSELDLSGCWAKARYSYPYGRRFCEKDAARMGVNIVTYAMASFEMGKQAVKSMVLTDTRKATGNELRVAHLKYGGQWNTNPSAISMLLAEIERTASLEVKFGECAIRITELTAHDFPFAYLAGHRSFELSAAEKGALREYFSSGGFLLAESCCGRIPFDRCFRSLIAEVAGAQLSPLPADHPLFGSFHQVKDVGLTAMGLPKGRPQLEAAHVDNRLAVVYSKYGLSCGWQHKACPYCRGYSAADAMRLGVNIVMYSMMH